MALAIRVSGGISTEQILTHLWPQRRRVTPPPSCFRPDDAGHQQQPRALPVRHLHPAADRRRLRDDAPLAAIRPAAPQQRHVDRRPSAPGAGAGRPRRPGQQPRDDAARRPRAARGVGARLCRAVVAVVPRRRVPRLAGLLHRARRGRELVAERGQGGYEGQDRAIAVARCRRVDGGAGSGRRTVVLCRRDGHEVSTEHQGHT